MKTKTTGRVAWTIGISMTPDIRERALTRVESLRPRVSTLSNYVQQLIALDVEQGLLGPSLLGKRVLAAGS